MESKRQASKTHYMRTYMAKRRAAEKAAHRRHQGLPPAGSAEEAALHASLPSLPPETPAERHSRHQAEQQRLQKKQPTRKEPRR